MTRRLAGGCRKYHWSGGGVDISDPISQNGAGNCICTIMRVEERFNTICFCTGRSLQCVITKAEPRDDRDRAPAHDVGYHMAHRLIPWRSRVSCAASQNRGSHFAGNDTESLRLSPGAQASSSFFSMPLSGPAN